MKSITSQSGAAPLLSACWQNFLSLLLPDKPHRGRRRSAAHGAATRH